MVYAWKCENIAITGPGAIDPNGRKWWEFCHSRREGKTINALRELIRTECKPPKLPDYRVYGTVEDGVRPPVFAPIYCKNVLFEGFSVIKPGSFWTFDITYCENVIVRGLTILSVGAPNGDGVNIDSTKNVLIEYCFFDTGDDCITMKSGMNEDGWRVGIPTENVVVRHVHTKRGHGGIVIGSEMSGDVRNVYTHNCHFEGTDNGIRLKSGRGRGGVVENILVKNVTMKNIRTNAFRINTAYARQEGGKPPLFRNIHIENIDCQGVSQVVYAHGLPEANLRNIAIKDFKGRGRRGLEITLVDGLTLENVEIEAGGSEQISITDCKNVSRSNVVAKPRR